MKIITTLLALSLSVSAFNAYAGDEFGTVRFEFGQFGSTPTDAGKTFFYLDSSTHNSPPACATFYEPGQPMGDRWVINNNHPAARIQLDILMAAFLKNKEVKIIGSGDCGVWGDTETATNITFK